MFVMINWDLVSIVIFYLILLLLFFRFRDKFVNQGLVVLYKTKFGLKLMDRFAKKFPKLINVFAFTGVVVGFSGMAFIVYFLIKETFKLVLVPGTESALAPVLPGIQIAGAPTLSFWHWIITIFVAALLHEFAHGVIARSFNVNVKSSGFAFLGPLLAAFVEPEEKELEKKSIMEQLKVFAAGPFMNIVFGFLVLLFLAFVFIPVTSNFYQNEGIIVNQVMDGYPMNESGIEMPFVITSVNGEETLSYEEFTAVTSDLKPGDIAVVGTDRGDYNVTLVGNPENESLPFFGIMALQESKKFKSDCNCLSWLGGLFNWIELLLLWLFLISLGVGLFNLLPLGPVDGGRMFYVLMLGIFKKESVAKKILIVSTVICVALIVINMIPWINKLLVFLWNIILLVVGLFL